MPDHSDSISISSPLAFPFQSRGLLGVSFPFLGHCRFMLAKEGSVGFLCHCAKHLETPFGWDFWFYK